MRNPAARVLYALINRNFPLPPLDCRRRLLVRVGERLRFDSGLVMEVQSDPAAHGHELRMVWSHRDAALVALTAYEPVSIASQRVVLRAVAMLDGRPVAVVAEVEQLAHAPAARVEVAQ